MKSDWCYNLDNSFINEKNIECYKAFNVLMGSFDFSGIFSESIIKTVYGLASRILQNKHNVIDNKITLEDAAEKNIIVFNEFKQILDTYIIFSDIFKQKCYSQFLKMMAE